MSKFLVAVDIDDTVCCLTDALDNVICKRYPDVKINHDEYFFEKRYLRDGVSIHSDVIRRLLYNKVDWLNLTPAPDAQISIKRLQKAGAQIVFITHRCKAYTPDVINTTNAWLKKYFNKFEVIYAKDKITTAENLGCVYLIDNSHEVLRQRYSDTVNMIFYTGVKPTTVANCGLVKYKSWGNIVDRILRDRKKA